jgi:hypothetical protein
VHVNPICLQPVWETQVKTGYPEPSVGPVYRAECCGSTIQSLHRYHIDWCACGRYKITGGAMAPRLICRVSKTPNSAPTP